MQTPPPARSIPHRTRRPAGTAIDEFCSQLVAQFSCEDAGAAAAQRSCCDIKKGVKVEDKFCAQVGG